RQCRSSLPPANQTSVVEAISSLPASPQRAVGREPHRAAARPLYRVLLGLIGTGPGRLEHLERRRAVPEAGRLSLLLLQVLVDLEEVLDLLPERSGHV